MGSIQDQISQANVDAAKKAQKDAGKAEKKELRAKGLKISIPDGVFSDSFITALNPVYNVDKNTKEKTLACYYVVIKRNQFTNQRGKDLQQMSTKTLRQLSVLFSGSETFNDPHFEKLVVNTEKLNESISS